MDHDDEHTPADTPRARASSVSKVTSELVLELLAACFSAPWLSPEKLRKAGRAEELDAACEIIADNARAAVSRALRVERVESNKVLEQNRALEVKLDIARRAMVRNEP